MPHRGMPQKAGREQRSAGHCRNLEPEANEGQQADHHEHACQQDQDDVGEGVIPVYSEIQQLLHPHSPCSRLEGVRPCLVC